MREPSSDQPNKRFHLRLQLALTGARVALRDGCGAKGYDGSAERTEVEPVVPNHRQKPAAASALVGGSAQHAEHGRDGGPLHHPPRAVMRRHVMPLVRALCALRTSPSLNQLFFLEDVILNLAFEASATNTTLGTVACAGA
jgi:hypothetical protein